MTNIYVISKKKEDVAIAVQSSSSAKVEKAVGFGAQPTKTLFIPKSPASPLSCRPTYIYNTISSTSALLFLLLVMTAVSTALGLPGLRWQASKTFPLSESQPSK